MNQVVHGDHRRTREPQWQGVVHRVKEVGIGTAQGVADRHQLGERIGFRGHGDALETRARAMQSGEDFRVHEEDEAMFGAECGELFAQTAHIGADAVVVPLPRVECNGRHDGRASDGSSDERLYLGQFTLPAQLWRIPTRSALRAPRSFLRETGRSTHTARHPLLGSGRRHPAACSTTRPCRRA